MRAWFSDYEPRFSDYWPWALALQVLTTALIGFAAWMNWQTYEHRKALTQEVAELRSKVEAQELRPAMQTKQPAPKGPGQ